MLKAEDFAQRVWVSLEDIRERLTALEVESRHARETLQRLETALTSHQQDDAKHGAAPRSSSPRPPAEPGFGAGADNGNGNGNGVTVTVRLSRKLVGGGWLAGGLAAALALGKALGWW